MIGNLKFGSIEKINFVSTTGKALAESDMLEAVAQLKAQKGTPNVDHFVMHRDPSYKNPEYYIVADTKDSLDHTFRVQLENAAEGFYDQHRHRQMTSTSPLGNFKWSAQRWGFNIHDVLTPVREMFAQRSKEITVAVQPLSVTSA